MAAATKNIVFEQGAAFRLRLRWLDKNRKPVNLTGYTAKMQVRLLASPSSPVLVEASTLNGRIALGGAQGTIEFDIPEAVMTALTFIDAYYDLVLSDAALVPRRFLQGTVRVSPGVTQ